MRARKTLIATFAVVALVFGVAAPSAAVGCIDAPYIAGGDASLIDVQHQTTQPGFGSPIGFIQCPVDTTSFLFREIYTERTDEFPSTAATAPEFFERWAAGEPAWIGITPSIDLDNPFLPYQVEMICGQGPENAPTTTQSVIVNLESPVPFIDTFVDDFFFFSVVWARAAGVTGGLTCTLFAPEASVSRWQMALFLQRYVNLLQIDVSSPLDTFSDTAALSAEARQAVGWLASTGVTTGIGGNQFDPSGTVTRVQMALFITRLADVLGVDVGNGADTFADTGTVGAEAKRAIAFLAAAEITTGVGNNLFDPGGLVTRGQMVTFLDRFDQYLASLVA